MHQSYLLDVHRLRDSLELDSFHAFGHSMGGFVLFNYASLFPDYIDSMVGFDAVGTNSPNYENFAFWLKLYLESALKIEKSEKMDRFYSYDEIKSRLLQGGSRRAPDMKHSINENVIHHVLDRNIIESNGKYRFSLDHKAKIPMVIPGFNNSGEECAILEAYSKFKKPHLVFLFTENEWIIRDVLNEAKRSEVIRRNKMYQRYLQANPLIKYKLIYENHHAHLNCPEVVAKRLNSWIADPYNMVIQSFKMQHQTPYRPSFWQNAALFFSNAA